MKKTIITLASLAALAGATNAQTLNYYAIEAATGKLFAWDAAGNSLGMQTELGGWSLNSSSYNSAAVNGNRVYSVSTISGRVDSWSLDGSDYAGGVTLAGYSDAQFSDFGYNGNQFFSIESATGKLFAWDAAGNSLGMQTELGGWSLNSSSYNNAAVNGNRVYSVSTISGGVDSWSLDGSDYAGGGVTLTGYSDAQFSSFGVTTVPEPSSAALLGLGGLALILRRRK